MAGSGSKSESSGGRRGSTPSAEKPVALQKALAAAGIDGSDPHRPSRNVGDGSGQSGNRRKSVQAGSVNHRSAPASQPLLPETQANRPAATVVQSTTIQPQRVISVSNSDDGQSDAPVSTASSSTAPIRTAVAMEERTAQDLLINGDCLVPEGFVEILHPAYRSQLEALAYEGGPVGAWFVVNICERQRAAPGLPLPWADQIIAIPYRYVQPGDTRQTLLEDEHHVIFVFQAAFPSVKPDIVVQSQAYIKDPAMQAKFQEAFQCFDLNDPMSLRRLLDATQSADGSEPAVDLERARSSLQPAASQAEAADASELVLRRPRASMQQPEQPAQEDSASLVVHQQSNTSTQQTTSPSLQICNRFGCGDANCRLSHSKQAQEVPPPPQRPIPVPVDVDDASDQEPPVRAAAPSREGMPPNGTSNEHRRLLSASSSSKAGKRPNDVLNEQGKAPPSLTGDDVPAGMPRGTGSLLKRQRRRVIADED